MSHGPPDLPIHLVPPLGGLLSTRGGHGKGLQPCFTIRDNLTDRTARDRSAARPRDGLSMPPTADNDPRGGAMSCCARGHNLQPGPC